MINFDSIAERFDAAQTWPDSVAAAFTAALAYLMPDNPRPILEIGMGSGRIAAILAEQNVPVIGINAMFPLLHQAQVRYRAQTRPEALPFPDQSLGMIYTVQQLYADESWQSAIGEVQRTLTADGLYVNRTTAEVSSDVINHMDVGWYSTLKRSGVNIDGRPESRSKARFDAALQEGGASKDLIRVARWREDYSPRLRLKRIKARKALGLRNIPDPIFKRLLDDYERWLKSQYGDLDTRLEILNEVAIDVWRWD